MHVLKAADHRRMAWKNGGGETIEIAVHPAGAGLADFDWRVSMARVAVDGPFSVFPGIDRTLCLTEGAGMELAVEGSGLHRLTAASEPLAFPADAPTTARLLGGPIRDLNVMTRRGVARHAVRRIEAGNDAAFVVAGRWNLVLAIDSCRIEVEGFAADMEANDALFSERSLSLVVHATAGPARVYAVEIADAS